MINLSKTFLLELLCLRRTVNFKIIMSLKIFSYTKLYVFCKTSKRKYLFCALICFSNLILIKHATLLYHLDSGAG